jgi:hypothetical protein
MCTLFRCLTLMALATYFLVGGALGLCTVWGGLGLQHHHHGSAKANDVHSDLNASICGNDSANCERSPTDDQQPCRDSAGHDGEKFLALTLNSPTLIASPLTGDVSLPAPDFSAASAPRAIGTPANLLGSVRGSPPGPPALLCRFLV